MRIVTIC